MKTPCRLILTALIPIASLGIVSCSSIEAEKVTTGEIQTGVPGGRVTETTTVNATVTGIDAPKRKVTLVTPEGNKFTVTAGPAVKNFNQIHIGDQLRATLAKEVTLRMAKPGEKIEEGSLAVVGSAALGAKPGAMAGEVHQFTGTITAIDVAKHTATLQFSDGSSTTLAVRSDVDLSQRRVGEKVVARATEAFAISLEKP